MEEYYKRLADKYLDNTASEEEEKQVLLWFTSPNGQTYLQMRIDNDLALPDNDIMFSEGEHIDSGKIFNRIQHAKKTGTTSFKPDSTEKTQDFAHFYYKHWTKIAASVAGFILLAFAAWFYSTQYNVVVHQTAFGETATVILPDNSTVVLNGNTTIRYVPSWDDKQPRKVWLEGEAFFQVVHTKNSQLFIVKTSDQFKVEVLGTAFNVFNRQHKTKVTLNSGKVRLNISEENDFLIMKPGEMVEFDDVSTKYVKKTVNPEVYSSWKSKKLIFENTSLSDIIHLLEDTYGLTVEVSNADLLNQKLNGTVPNDNIDILLEGLSQLFEIEISRNKNHVKFNTYQ